MKAITSIATNETLEQDSGEERLHDMSPEIEAAWAEESKARYDAYKRGEIKAVSMDEVFRKYKNRW